MISKYYILLNTILEYIVPQTRIAVKNGNKIFGAAILNKFDGSIICIGTNNEIENPLFHGEISALLNFFKISSKKKLNIKDCIFLSTHEPCSLCLSAITWSGFNNFYYLFPYKDTKKKFNIPHDLNILKEVFKIEKGQYRKKNSYWKSYSILDFINKINEPEKSNFVNKINKISKIYENFSKIYQKQKKKNIIPLN